MKSDSITFRLEPDDRDALLRAAEANDRSLSSLARKVLVDWLRENGWTKAKGATR
jgi:uncharacterized protein (DUF1778 family)